MKPIDKKIYSIVVKHLAKARISFLPTRFATILTEELTKTIQKHFTQPRDKQGRFIKQTKAKQNGSK